MPRSHRRPGVVRITCTDPLHEGTRQWQKNGYRHVSTLYMAERADNSDGPRVTLYGGDGPDALMKDRRRSDGQWVFRFRCTCGRDVQRAEADLVDIVQRYTAAFPGRRVAIDLVRLG